jgi:hypothetical protein
LSSNVEGEFVTIGSRGSKTGPDKLVGVSQPAGGRSDKGGSDSFGAIGSGSSGTIKFDHIFFVGVSYYYNLLPVLMLLKCNFD